MGVGRQRGLGDAHELRAARCWAATGGDGLLVLLAEACAVNELTRKQAGVAGIDHGDATQHLVHDDLDVLVVNVDALRTVHVVHFVHDVHLGGTRSENAQDLLRIHGTLDQLGARIDVLAVLDEHRRATGRLVGDGLERVVVRLQNDLTATLGVLHLDGAGELRDWRLTLRRTGFEQLGDTRKALRDIGCRGDATGVEGTKRQLRCASPMDCAATMPTASPTSTSLLVASDQP